MTLTGGGSFNDKVNFIWSVADLLRGDFRQSEYGKVILPLVVIRRLDCVLEPTKQKVVDRAAELEGRLDNPERALCSVSGEQFYNVSPLDFDRLTADPENIASNLRAYIGGFSPGAREVIDKFRFDDQIRRLDDANLLYEVVAKFAGLDLHPDVVDNHEMGYVYEELIRRFSEQSNETAGEHFTPREVIRLMVNLLFVEDDEALSEPGAVRTIFDPACGTGGMLAVAEEHLRSLNPDATLSVYGQELNDESYAICRSDMMIKGHDATNIRNGNSFSDDHFAGHQFDYMLANPPFGVKWEKVKKPINDEHKNLGFAGRFGAGLPRVDDGSLLFLQHMISKMKPAEKGGSRIAIVFNAGPMFSGAAGSGPSEIRRWIIENDWLEAVVGLPDQLFYNTAISTYFWIVTNRKRPDRRGKVQLIDASGFFDKMEKSLGDKRKFVPAEAIAQVTELYGAFENGPHVTIVENEALGFQRITVDRPALGPNGEPLVDGRGRRIADKKQRRTYETLPLPPGQPVWNEHDPGALARLRGDGHEALVAAHVREDIERWTPDAWVDPSETRIGYEIPLLRIQYGTPTRRPLDEIRSDTEKALHLLESLVEEHR